MNERANEQTNGSSGLLFVLCVFSFLPEPREQQERNGALSSRNAADACLHTPLTQQQMPMRCPPLPLSRPAVFDSRC